MIGEFKQGLLIGLAVSVPVGPIALLIMRRSLRDGKLAGWISGLGAATADSLCGAAAAFGLSAVMSTLEHHPLLVRTVGGILLIGLGFHTTRARTRLETDQPIHQPNLILAFLSTGALTLANPLTWLGMAFVSAAAGVGERDLTSLNTGFLVAGIFTSAGCWWLLLSSSAGWFGKRLGNQALKIINLVAGSIIIAVGIYQLVEVLSTRVFAAS